MASAPTPPPPPPGGFESPIPVEVQGQTVMIVTSTVAILIPMLLVGLRFYAKRIVGKGHEWSDYCIVIALFFNFGLQITGWLLVLKGGLGFPILDVMERFGPDVAKFFYQALVAYTILWNFTTLFGKLSMLLLFTSIIPVRNMVIPARAAMLFLVLAHGTWVIMQFVICRPFARIYDSSIPGQCDSQKLYYFLMGLINIFLDVVILVLPMPFIYKLRLPWSKKAMLFAIFAVGSITCAIAIYRQAVLPELTFEDLTGTGLMATVFSGLEPAIAIALACVPYLRPLFPRTSSAEYGSQQYALPYSSPRRAGSDKAWPAKRGVPGGGMDDCAETVRDTSSELHLKMVETERGRALTTKESGGAREDQASRSSSGGIWVTRVIRIERKWEQAPKV
ncbi:uncharacterized protein B0I36DRAFT_358110 [Microdochium trichocladiopsis]|uniref:Rhodopsin domain-containing protein n=1 Tax=Microdochium trichocladiopsis TaxID=1682393 RepID=A0A9P8YKV7_9PEZI|nr:uncharacterized protein B0I36DRAFT_358110 [Microdochium trichocladiopsis]KAH7040869.1 hypothetical protein B0I36DRAFT_358110 [Microdochium trichocladiopsis]